MPYRWAPSSAIVSRIESPRRRRALESQRDGEVELDELVRKAEGSHAEERTRGGKGSGEGRLVEPPPGGGEDRLLAARDVDLET
jgi:hypothetical protein